MRASRRHSVTVNTGSMADIAFLLLIFFLVSTTISAEKGITRQLPPYCDNPESCIAEIKEENILEITLNGSNEILISGKSVNLNEVSTLVKDFVDNDGLSQCDYCNGEKQTDFSEHPTKAVISLNYNSSSSYQAYVAIQNEINKAYKELRQSYSLRYFDKSIESLNTIQINQLKQNYPIKVVDRQFDRTLNR